MTVGSLGFWEEQFCSISAHSTRQDYEGISPRDRVGGLLWLKVSKIWSGMPF